MKLFCNFAVIVVFLVTLSVLPSTDATAKCEAGDNGPKCSSCARKGTCKGVSPGGDVLFLEACPEGKACTMESGLAVCKPTAETECDCGGKTTGCDIYNPQRINICLPNKRPIPAKYCDETQLCSDAKCVGPEDTVCADKPNLAFVLSTPDCASSALCYDTKVVAVQLCGSGQYFNVEREQCEIYSPNPCANCAESMCPILSDCTKYAACANGQLVSEETCASSDTYFDFGQQKCVPKTGDVDNKCIPYDKCDFKLIATTEAPTTTSTLTTPPTPPAQTPPTTPVVTRPATCTAANSGQRYPHETSCKKYYSCRETTRNNYVFVESTCPGTSVFNPSNRFCDDPAKVPGCKP